MKRTIIALVIAALLLIGTACAEMKLAQDFIVRDGTGYAWIGDVGCGHMIVRVDYPEFGVIEAQNIRMELNDAPTVMLWHDADTRCAVFNVEYIGGEIYAAGACGDNPMILPQHVAGIRDTDCDGILWAALAGNVIPSGTRVRVWTDAEAER